MDNKKYCTICGKEKDGEYNSFAQRYFYIECECERAEREAKEEKRRQKGIEKYTELRALDSGLLKKERQADFSKLLRDKYNERAITAAEYITDVLLGNKTDSKNGLVLYGNRGSGKTYIAAAIINEYNKKHPLNESALKSIIKQIENGYADRVDVIIKSDCKFIKEDELINLYGRYSYSSDTTPFDEFKKAKRLLVVDDIGVSAAPPDKVKTALLNIIDYRLSECLSTVVTTNLTKDELWEYIGDRAFDRLRSCCYFMGVSSGESRRNQPFIS